MRDEPHLVWVSRSDLDGQTEVLVIHLSCAITERDEQCTVDHEHANLGVGLVDGWDPGLYWLRAWPHIHVGAEGEEYSVEYEIVPIRDAPDWVTANLP